MSNRPSWPASRLIQLGSASHRNVWLPDVPIDEQQAPTFSLPGFPLSQSAWLAGLGEEFYKLHERCLIVLLILDLDRRCWTRPVVPTQRAAHNGASFKLLESDLQHLPAACRAAGSFQFCTQTTPEEAISQVPAFDGLHRLHIRGGKLVDDHFWFLRAKGEPHMFEPTSVLIDDWRQYLHQFQDRLTLA